LIIRYTPAPPGTVAKWDSMTAAPAAKRAPGADLGSVAPSTGTGSLGGLAESPMIRYVVESPTAVNVGRGALFSK
jgi:hypothetical protein